MHGDGRNPYASFSTALTCNAHTGWSQGTQNAND